MNTPLDRTPLGGPPDATPAAAPVVNVLLVDDEPKNLTVLESVLTDPGYRLVRADSADQALLALVAQEFAVLVLDIQMPGMTGFELAQMIKQRKKTAAVPIIFLTAYYSEDQHILEGYGSGAVDYLHKPVNPVVLRSKVAVFAELHRKSLEIGRANRALVDLNNDLERRVEERTAELRRVNAALSQNEELLKESNRRKDEFLAMLSHELRNPLAPIRNAVSILKSVATPNADLQWCCEVLDRQSEQLAHLVDDLLDVSRVSRGKIQLHREVVNLTDIVRQAVESCQPLIQSRRHELTTTFPAEPLYVDGDATRLVQVAANLLHNAAKYTDAGGTIGVELNREADGQQAALHVRDNGCGFDPTAGDALFELFFQAERDLARSEGGLGIGLSLVRSLVKMHGGSVEAHSGGLGQGSEFVIRLPCVAAPAAAPPASPPPEKSRPAGLRILVVDDNRDSAQSMGLLLRALGHQVSQAHDGLAAVEAALRDRPDVVLLDIGLPRLNGYETCRRLRAQGLTTQLLVAMTGYGQDEDRRLSHEAGFDVHLVKPVKLAAIQQVLEKLALHP